MAAFALRALLQKPFMNGVLAVCLLSFSFFVMTGMLFQTRLSGVIRRAAAAGPSLVVRNANPAHPDITPSDVETVRRIIGVTDATMLRNANEGVPRLGVSVYDDGEIAAVTAAVEAALPWPTEIISKDQYAAAALRTVAARGLLPMWMLVPAALALLYLLLGQAGSPLVRPQTAALLKAFGWTSRDILRFYALSAGTVGVPAALLGAAAAWVWIRFGDVGGLEAALFGFRAGPVAGPLSVPEALFAFAVSVSVVFALWVPAVMIPAVRAALRAPDDLLREDA